MPRKARKAREKELNDLFNGFDAAKAQTVFSCSDDLSANLGLYAGNLVAFDDKGEPYMREQKPKSPLCKANDIKNLSTANHNRHIDALTDAKKLKAACIDIWGVRGKTHIVQQRAIQILGKHISEKTVRNYIHKTK